MCDLCNQSFGHDPRCPHYHASAERELSGEICVICGEPIYKGENALQNGDDCFHFSCFKNTPAEELIDLLALEPCGAAEY
jgi:hypothetical protein